MRQPFRTYYRIAGEWGELALALGCLVSVLVFLEIAFGLPDALECVIGPVMYLLGMLLILVVFPVCSFVAVATLILAIATRTLTGERREAIQAIEKNSLVLLVVILLVLIGGIF